MNWAMFALGLFLGSVGGIVLAALLHAADESPCADCLDGAKVDSWDCTVMLLEALGEPVVSPRVIGDLARMAYAKTPESEDEPVPAWAPEGYRSPPLRGKPGAGPSEVGRPERETPRCTGVNSVAWRRK